ncbi:insulinase family protein [Anaerosacchariphilus polymeriproducens]|uniref:Insulinase family protein n=1 Tax=Anaerosacchariphilus polymeriproducens TaxID=1812858 RepID=A0A371AZ22_9FIRM|nr:insulinase family protein [Anaerosacchariphilus polymeriproducens]RDU24844.1 insulinase family protein [Anaerosacchariphilus polymeriproducens]
MDIKKVKEYQLLEEKTIHEINSKGYLLKHNKSGARVTIISNDDINKVFYIGFRTPPEDSTGVAHILEHSVLCGSKKFPLKDPFVELAKGSLNTFLNAMTYPDKTVYPVASCNDKDFQNLISVYMDAVFYPNIYKKEEIFQQEGWHYELESEKDPLKISGVVYNEMKGAFSSPEGVLEREILNSLFPDTSYAVESGGDPEVIPELTYEQFLDFHKKYYHPTNSYIYLYGNMDIEEKLKWLDQEYLSEYDIAVVDSEIKLQKPFEKTSETQKLYSITSTESEEDNTYLSFNKVIGTSLDKKLYLAFQILEYALLTAPGAPLKKALLDAKIGKDIMGSYDNGVYQPIFSIIAKNSNLTDKYRFLSIIEDTLKTQVKNKINRNALKAGINYYEFKYREADYGNYPKGLIYGLECFDSWLYDEMKPFLHLESKETFDFLKNQLETDYFEKLIQEYLIDNTHASVVIAKPEKGLTAKMEQELELKLEKYKSSLTKEEINQLIEDTKNLREYQDEPSSKEDLEKIPLLELKDIRKEALPLSNNEVDLDGIKVLHHNIPTNGIGYIKLLFDARNISKEDIPYLGILKSVLGYVDTKNYEYAELSNEINMNTGGFSVGIGTFTNVKDLGDFEFRLEVKVKAFYEKLDVAFKMLKEVIFTSKLEDEKRLYEIVAQLKSRLQMSMNTSGHSIASVRAMSYFSKTALLNDMTSGVAFYRVIESIENDFEAKKEILISKLKGLVKQLFTPDNLLISFTAEEEGFKPFEAEVKSLKDELYEPCDDKKPFELLCKQENEGFKASSKVQYVSMAGNFIQAGFSYTGVMKVLKIILSYDYLWMNVRVKGGAYGCMSGFTKAGDSYFASYRDPNLEKTIETFLNTPEYLKNFQVGERDMLKYIIGTVSDLDNPLNPAAQGSRSLSSYLNNITYEDIQKERDEILGTTQEDIRKLTDIVKTVIEQNNLCVIGNEEKLEEQKSLFQKLENLYTT